jgi:hypothetical protein
LWGVFSYVVDLGTLSIVLVFTSEGLVFEAVENFCDGFGRLCQHGLQRYTGLQFAVVFQVEDTVLDHCRDNNIVARKLTRIT